MAAWIILGLLLLVIACFFAAIIAGHLEQRQQRKAYRELHYQRGRPLDQCIKCEKQFPTDELYYEGVEPHLHSPMCRLCIVKDAREKYGTENVITGRDN